MDEIKKTIRDSAIARWTVLILISLLMFATYWFQDFYSGLKGLMESQLHFSSSNFGLLISSTTWINLAGGIIIGGIILDKWGIRLAGILFGSLALLGAFLNWLGASGLVSDNHNTQLTIMIIGRLLFGPGLEVTCVTISKTIVKWFKGHELALAFGINMGFGRFGSALGMALSVDIAGGTVAPAVAFAGTLIALGLLAFLIHIIFDIRLDKQRAVVANAEADEEKFKFADLIKLVTNRSFIFIALLCVAFYSAVFPFIQYAPDLLVNKFGFSSEFPDMSGESFLKWLGALFSNGPKVAALIPLGTILFTPVFGGIIDKKGKAASLMILGSLLLIFAHLSLSVFQNVIMGYTGLLSLGIAFSLVPAAMWPSVAKIVVESRIGTAYAMMFTIQNYGLALFFWGIGKVLDLANKGDITAIRAGEMNYDYTVPIFMLVILGVISIFLANQLRRADKIQKYGLELPSGVKPE
jgi:MFS family permease